MTANELMELMNKMENRDKNQFLDMIYDEYFDKGIPMEQLIKDARILQAYYDGELVEAPDEYAYYNV
ncbi:MAG: hypothetical protein FWC73_07315 [Defluviitaleaceae bacterium]|nr:hypothetical protein [Defluviitaleaceae bacterium]